MVTQAVRRIPVQYAKQVAGSKMSVGGERQYIPLKLNASGVMPIIFAQALMFIPGLVAQSFAEKVSSPLRWLKHLVILPLGSIMRYLPY